MLTVFRWSQRVDGIAASNAFWAFIDARFPDSPRHGQLQDGIRAVRKRHAGTGGGGDDPTRL